MKSHLAALALLALAASLLSQPASAATVRVQAGRSGDGMTEILAGLKGGEKVVASGQFLIDSEASFSKRKRRSKPLK